MTGERDEAIAARRVAQALDEENAYWQLPYMRAQAIERRASWAYLLRCQTRRLDRVSRDAEE